MRFKLVILTILVWTAGSLAAPMALGPAADVEFEYEFNSDREELYCQPPDEEGFRLASQEDTLYPFEAWTADDFHPNYGWLIDEVCWWGEHWGFNELAMPEAFIITFWSDNDCVPGDVLYELYVYDYEAEEMPGLLYHYAYSADIAPFTASANTVFWMSIQAVLFFSPNGQWGWLTTINAEAGCASMQLFPHIGIDPWEAHGNGDMSFCLYGSSVTATETGSFSLIKSLY